ncbi:SLIT and NTRK-like protein 6 isoform X1 [Malaclemys terrapin pileata]|uniref:SLIT and NTRK-like protein 6 isoform X1 n=1 Tax=Malaclemys terrapin pileata TaxID=2991368 RepID=UPI0023A85268|nr:SLIT and NTRK-like protein 6 isoform X1 [Malaclemys terrapin pileata]
MRSYLLRDQLPGRELWAFILWAGLLLATQLALGTVEEACNCSTAVAFSDFQAAPALQTCCLNFTGAEIGSLDWSLFGGVTGLRELYLSHCGVVDIINAPGAPGRLEILHLDHNQLEKLPESFLEDAPRLRVLRLDSNKLRKLPKSFLRASTQIQEIHLGFNDLASLPASVFKPSLTRLGLANNSWDCTCTLLGDLEKYPPEPPSGDMQGPVVVCSTPERYRSMDIRDIRKQELCRAHSLTALFICLPLVVVLALVAWCFCRQKRKTGYALSRRPECHLATVERNGAKGLAEPHRYIQCELPTAPAESEKNTLLRNQVLLKPSTALLGSNRDLYEEVEIKLGALDDSFVLVNEGSLSLETGPAGAPAAEELAGSDPEAETVSVTDVLKDSVDREKLYMGQAVDYYNLVPAIELEDSDQQEYETIDLH